MTRSLAGALLVITMAAAISGRAEARSPCDHYLPTGAPLPRQDSAQAANIMTDAPGSGHDVGRIGRDQPATIVRECGVYLQIRTPDDRVGWVPVATFPHELALEQAAYNATRHPPRRPSESIAECERQVHDPIALGVCKHHVRDTLGIKGP